MFFTAVNPMLIWSHMERDYDVTKSRIAVCKHTWKIHQNTVYCGVILRVAQRKGLQFYQTRSNAIILGNTSLAVCIEKVVIRKSGEELYNQNVPISFLPQRIALKPNLHCGRQDTHKLWRETIQAVQSFKETCRGEIDFRIQGLPHSAVQEQDHTARQQSKSWFISSRRIQIEKRWKQTWSKITSSTIQRAVERHDLQHGKHGVLRDVRDIFQSTVPQLCNILDDSHLYTVLVEHACDLQTKLANLNKDRFDVLSIPNYVIKKKPISRCTSRKHRGKEFIT